MNNRATVKFISDSVNESFARICVSAFISPLNPTINELQDIKTAISEGVTNAIVHGYPQDQGEIEMRMKIDGTLLTVEIIDYGVGISDINEARLPFFTTSKDGTRSGMGFTVMESFMDSVKVVSALQEGTRVIMKKKIGEDN